MENKKVDPEKVRRSGSQAKPDRSFTSQDQSRNTNEEVGSGRRAQHGGTTEGADQLDSDSANREATAKKPF